MTEAVSVVTSSMLLVGIVNSSGSSVGLATKRQSIQLII